MSNKVLVTAELACPFVAREDSAARASDELDQARYHSAMPGSRYRRTLSCVLFLSGTLGVGGIGSLQTSWALLPAQSGQPPSTPGDAGRPNLGDARPLPDVAALMHSVEDRQRAAEALQQDYIFRSSIVETQTDSAGHPKKAETREYDVFWLQGVPVRKLVVKDGRPASASELRKEDERIDKEVQKAHERRVKNDHAGKQTDPRGDEEITVSRMLALGSFRNARRVKLGDRDTIAVDYVGDPNAKTRNRAEAVFRDLSGTVWINESDKEVVQLQGHFAKSFKIAGGLLADIREGTSFAMQQEKINGMVWLPTHIEAKGSARLLVFTVHGEVQVRNSDFRRFRATATIVPIASKP